MTRFSIRDKSNDSWLKLITTTHPMGLWAVAQSAKTFDTEEGAKVYLDKLINAVATDALRQMGRLLDRPLNPKHKVTRFFAIADNAGCDIQCYEIVPTLRTTT